MRKREGQRKSRGWLRESSLTGENRLLSGNGEIATRGLRRTARETFDVPSLLTQHPQQQRFHLGSFIDIARLRKFHENGI